jgi:hypothetical protein
MGLGCDSRGKKMCGFDSGKPKTQVKSFFEREKKLRGLLIGCLNWAGDSLYYIRIPK